MIRVEHGKRALISQPSDQEKSLHTHFGYRHTHTHTSSMGEEEEEGGETNGRTLVGANMSGLLDKALISHPLFLVLPPIADKRLFPIGNKM